MTKPIRPGEILDSFPIETLEHSTVETIEQEARRIISGEKRAEYGSVQDSFSNIALVWTGILRNRKLLLDKELTGQEVALLLAGLKLVREANKPKRDNRVDGVAYLLLLDDLCPSSTI